MYANFRAHGGSNHLLVPTDVLAGLVPAATAEQLVENGLYPA